MLILWMLGGGFIAYLLIPIVGCIFEIIGDILDGILSLIFGSHD